jgi:hypothetical protein
LIIIQVDVVNKGKSAHSRSIHCDLAAGITPYSYGACSRYHWNVGACTHQLIIIVASKEEGALRHGGGRGADGSHRKNYRCFDEIVADYVGGCGSVACSGGYHGTDDSRD